ncbi:ATP synthase F1 subcomplex gamma subunit [Pontibacter ummariensis]|uniref:ATP synthase gamma chain n=1 Tax=Pontibacter ummariensis TaxID=1610492 RepID=A0A239CV07_9BACT|nr:ATP synthase F1 subunit gamma [Pontibacter ummariensis]PRY14815.1 ATP synthase F1 subcomplex gamma subunit [Pontibacter ummariensis]SNS23907.1 ATP synthase F1 subcomplex gamma subunit [Pontibacter ummariensis]
MASLKEVRSRITSVSSTQQITKAMKMVSAAKLRRAQDNILRMRPYAQRLSGILANLSSVTEERSVSNPYAEKRDVNRVLIIAVTSDRGLAGAFNSNIIKGVVALINERYSSQFAAGNVTILTIGRKGADGFRKRGFNVITDYTNIFSNLSFDSVREAAERAMNGFVSREFDRVDVVYNEFKNVATQVVQQEAFLPIEEKPAEEVVASTNLIDYTFEPSKEQIVEELIPKSLKIQIYKAVLESNASEHGARMTAMDKATENAGELLKQLKLTYNRTRQAAITKEILEIVGGAEALASE